MTPICTYCVSETPDSVFDAFAWPQSLTKKQIDAAILDAYGPDTQSLITHDCIRP